MSQEHELATQQREKFGDLLHVPEKRSQLEAALNGIMPVDQFTSNAIVTFSRPDIERCTPRSKLLCVLEMATFGVLETLKQCAVIVREIKDKRTGKVECQASLMVQWQGMKAVMERHKDILEVQAALVHKRDEFTFVDGRASHSLDPFDPKRLFRSAEDLLGGYAIILYRDGRPPRYHFVPVAHIEKARRCAQTDKIWKPWYEQMCLKTVYRDCYARRAVPVDPAVIQHMERILESDDTLLGNDPRVISVPSGNARLADALGISEQRPPSEHDEPEPTPEPAPSDPPGQPDFGDHKKVCGDYVMDIGICDTLDGLNAVATNIQENTDLSPETQTYFVEQVRKQAAKIKQEA